MNTKYPEISFKRILRAVKKIMEDPENISEDEKWKFFLSSKCVNRKAWWSFYQMIRAGCFYDFFKKENNRHYINPDVLTLHKTNDVSVEWELRQRLFLTPDLFRELHGFLLKKQAFISKWKEDDFLNLSSCVFEKFRIEKTDIKTTWDRFIQDGKEVEIIAENWRVFPPIWVERENWEPLHRKSMNLEIKIDLRQLWPNLDDEGKIALCNIVRKIGGSSLKQKLIWILAGEEN